MEETAALAPFPRYPVEMNSVAVAPTPQQNVRRRAKAEELSSPGHSSQSHEYMSIRNVLFPLAFGNRTEFSSTGVIGVGYVFQLYSLALKQRSPIILQLRVLRSGMATHLNA